VRRMVSRLSSAMRRTIIPWEAFAGSQLFKSDREIDKDAKTKDDNFYLTLDMPYCMFQLAATVTSTTLTSAEKNTETRRCTISSLHYYVYAGTTLSVKLILKINIIHFIERSTISKLSIHHGIVGQSFGRLVANLSKGRRFLHQGLILGTNDRQEHGQKNKSMGAAQKNEAQKCDKDRDKDLARAEGQW
jgi:hypothetical protein